MTDPLDTASAAAHGEPVSKTYRNVGVWLPGLAVASMRQGVLVLDGYTFENCAIDGPAVLAVVDKVAFQACEFGVTESVSDLLLNMRGNKLTGAIGFANTVFQECRFSMVGFTGNEEFLSALERNVKIGRGGA